MGKIYIRPGDLVQSTWALSNNPFAAPKRVMAVHKDGMVEAAGGFFHHDDLILLQRPFRAAKAKVEPVVPSTAEVNVEPQARKPLRCLGEDCAIAYDALVQEGFDTFEVPLWLVATAEVILP